MQEITFIQEIQNTLPLMISSFWIAFIILAEALFHNPKITRSVGLVGLLLSLISIFYIPTESLYAFSFMIKIGGITKLSFALILSAGIITFLFSESYLKRNGYYIGEYYVLLFISLVGMLYMTSAAHFIMLFLGIETMSIALYILAGFFFKEQPSNEASIKYFLLGAFSSGFLLYGISLIYGATGSLHLTAISQFIAQNPVTPLFLTGFVLVMIGFLFKISAVPFHQWTPDVYEGSPTSSVVFMSSISKGATFLALAAIGMNFSIILYSNEHARLAFKTIAIITMIIGNLAAIGQDNLKRMLAYSSIAHAGYMLIGFLSNTVLGFNSVVLYAVIYTFTNLGAFGLLALLESKFDIHSISDLKGLFQKNLSLAILMIIFFGSLIGIPPFAGFIAKYHVIFAALQIGEMWIVFVAIATSAISAFYYLKPLFYAFTPSEASKNFSSSFIEEVPLYITAAIIIVLGIFPGELISFISKSVQGFLF